MTEPRYTHDCDDCKFLGHFENYDLYACRQSWGPTVIARYGDEGGEYISGLTVSNKFPALTEAKRLAAERGLLDDIPLQASPPLDAAGREGA